MSLTPGQIGWMTSIYFFTFALAQLPVGIALDMYGPRLVQFVLLLVTALGAILFAGAKSFELLVIARAIMGLGLAACFMSAIKAISYWVPPSKLPSIHSYLLALGGLGAMSSTLPVKLALEFVDWREIFIILGIVTAITGSIIYVFTPKISYSMSACRVPPLRSIFAIYRNPKFLETISLLLIPHAVFFGIQGLWVGRLLRDVNGYSEVEIANVLFISMAGIVIGTICVGRITELAGKFGIKPLTVAAVGIFCFVLIQLGIILNIGSSMPYLTILFMLFGTFAGLEYTIIAQSVSPELTGRAATCLNLLILFGAFIVQAGFGHIIDLWPPNNYTHYPAIAYKVAFTILILLQLPGLVLWTVRQLVLNKFAPKENTRRNT